MNKTISQTAISALLLFLVSCTDEPKKNLVGKWETKQELNGQAVKLSANFRADGTYDGYANEKMFVSGKFRLNGDTLIMNEAGCGLDYDGIYKLSYYADSVRFALISDSCTPRRNGSDGLTLKRIQ